MTIAPAPNVMVGVMPLLPGCGSVNGTRVPECKQLVTETVSDVNMQVGQELNIDASTSHLVDGTILGDSAH
jgi:hypothetical protein